MQKNTKQISYKFIAMLWIALLSIVPSLVAMQSIDATDYRLNIISNFNGIYPSGYEIHPIEVEVVDGDGNRIVDFLGEVTVSVFSGDGMLIEGITNVDVVNGVAEFYSLIFYGIVDEQYSLQFSSAGVTGALSPLFTFEHGPATKLVLIEQETYGQSGYPLGATTGFFVEVKDSLDNRVIAYPGAIQASIYSGSGGELIGETILLFEEGVASFYGDNALTLKGSASEVYRLKFSADQVNENGDEVRPVISDEIYLSDGYLRFNVSTGELRINPGNRSDFWDGILNFVFAFSSEHGTLSSNINDYRLPSGSYGNPISLDPGVILLDTEGLTGFSVQTAFYNLPNVSNTLEYFEPTSDIGDFVPVLSIENLILGSRWVQPCDDYTVYCSTGGVIPGTTAVYASDLPGYESSKEFSLGFLGSTGLTIEQALQAFGATENGSIAYYTLFTYLGGNFEDEDYPVNILDATLYGVQIPIYVTSNPPTPDVVNLLRPNNDEQGVNLGPVFSWEPAERAYHYHLQVSEDSMFSAPVVDEKLIRETVWTYTGELKGETKYYYRVRGRNENGNGAWSQVRSFTTRKKEVVSVMPAMVQLIHPNNGDQNVDLSPVFAWEEAARAVSYHLQVSEVNDFSTTVINENQISDFAWPYDGELKGETTYFFRVRGRNANGNGAWSQVRSFTTIKKGVVVSIESNELPNELTLAQNYPNPFNPVTTIKFGLDVSGDVQLDVYDILGNHVITLVNGNLSAGWHSVRLDATALSSGTYVYRIQSGGRILSRTLMLIK